MNVAISKRERNHPDQHARDANAQAVRNAPAYRAQHLANAAEWHHRANEAIAGRAPIGTSIATLARMVSYELRMAGQI